MRAFLSNPQHDNAAMGALYNVLKLSGERNGTFFQTVLLYHSGFDQLFFLSFSNRDCLKSPEQEAIIPSTKDDMQKSL